MLTIFANHKTSKKVIAFCKEKERPAFQMALAMKHGGNWVVVDTFYMMTDYLIFDDGIEYRGYHPEIKRYFDVKQVRHLPL